MVNSFFKTAFRFFWRNKSYTILNYLCLTFGLTCAIVAALNMNRVFSYDKFHLNYDRLYEVDAHVTYFNGDRFPKEMLSASLIDILKENVPEIDNYSRVVNCSYQFVNGNEIFSETGIYAEPGFLDIFTFPLINGSSSKVLADNNSIVISEKMAMKFFKTTDCIGKSLTLNSDSARTTFTISGILKNVPAQSYFQFNFIIPFSKYLMLDAKAFKPGAASCQTWVLLNNESGAKVVNAKIKDLISKQETTLNQELFLFPLKEKILYYYIGGRRVWREMQNIMLIGGIGLAILLIACFNFINLTIALNIRRFREVGIKKVIGAHKSNIIFQHLGETSIITLISFLTSLDLVRLSVRILNRAFNGDVQFNFSDFRIILIFAGIALFTTLVSGLMPAWYLSSARPVEILRGKNGSGHSFSIFRQGLIVFQFTIPVILIIIVLIIKAQDNYIRNFDLGFDKEKMMIIYNTPATEAHSESIRNDLLTIPGIEYVSFTNCIPARGAKVSNEVSWEGKDTSQELHFWCINTDFSYDKTVNLKISDGRYFDKSFVADSGCYLINDIAAKVIGYDNPLGRTITLNGKKGTIIGVFRDFHSLDLAGPFTPVIISLSREGRSNLLIKIGSGNRGEISSQVNEVLKKYEPEKTIPVLFYSDLIKRTELTTVSYLVGLAFFISILLACLGLTGLASFTAASRTKEIGIRKINGATVSSIMKLLGMNYSKWLTIASVISLPFAILLASVFLSRFNFRISIPYWAFIAGPAIAWVVALGSIGLQSLRAATRNPVDSLRYE